MNLGPIPLAAGTYWLALHEGTMGTAFDGTGIYWDTTGSAPAGADRQITSQLSGLSGYSTSPPFKEPRSAGFVFNDMGILAW